MGTKETDTPGSAESRNLVRSHLSYEAWEGFGNRMQRLNPLFSLGKGMNVGPLIPYIQTILVQVILEIFYRELNDDNRRTKFEIILIVRNVLLRMKLTCEDKIVERMVYGLLYEGTETLNKPFESIYYDEVHEQWQSQTFRYLITDEIHTNLEQGGSIVYRLSEISQEMIFMSREMTEDFSITIEQLYSIQLIKNGNYKKAARNLDHLISRVNRLILEENQFRKDMLNDPKILIAMENKQREDKEGVIKEQFEDERKHFKTIMFLIDKAKTTEDFVKDMSDIIFLQEKVEYTRSLHDHFANLVIQNIATEINLKTENPSIFWEKSLVSFREHVYENWMVSKGIENFDTLTSILNPIFTPQHEFLLPLEWIWEEQQFLELDRSDSDDDGKDEDEEFLLQKTVNWETVAEVWTPVMDYLLQFGEFSLKMLSEFPEDDRYTWFEDYQTFELWMMFDRKPLEIHVLQGNGSFNDEREILLYHLMQKHDRFKVLEGKKIMTTYDSSDHPFIWEDMDIRITPFKLQLKE